MNTNTPRLRRVGGWLLIFFKFSFLLVVVLPTIVYFVCDSASELR